MKLRFIAWAFVFLGLAVGGVRAQGQHLLVLPFENTSRNPRLEWMGEGFAELCIERLAGEGRVLLAREERIAGVERIGLPSSSRYSRATMLKLATELDADIVVFGSFTSDGKMLSVTARAMRAEPLGLSEPLTESGMLEDLMEIHARLAWRVLEYVDSAQAISRQSFLQSLDRPRLDAFEQYIRGIVDSNENLRRRYLREAARLMPDWGPPALALGMDAYARRDCAGARTWLDRVSLDQPGGSQALFYSGLCSLQRNEFAAAEAAFSRVAERARSAEAMNNLGVARARQDKWREAAAVWLQAQIQDPGEPDYSFNLGLAALRTGESTAAARHFREALRRRPDDAAAQQLLTVALERPPSDPAAGSAPSPRIKTAFSASVPEARRPASATHRATHLQLHLARGREFLASGKLAEGQREFSEAILIAPESVEAHVGMAEALERLGRREEAMQELRAALQLEPGHANARRMLDALQSGSERGGRR